MPAPQHLCLTPAGLDTFIVKLKHFLKNLLSFIVLTQIYINQTQQIKLIRRIRSLCYFRFCLRKPDQIRSFMQRLPVQSQPYPCPPPPNHQTKNQKSIFHPPILLQFPVFSNNIYYNFSMTVFRNFLLEDKWFRGRIV